MKVEKTRKYYYDLAIVVLFPLITTFLYTTSTKNLTGAMWGDGYFHSLIAEHVFESGEVDFLWPYRLFDGLKIGGVVQNFPAHYTYIQHIGIGLVNHLTGLGLFSNVYTIFINIFISLGLFILFEKNRFLRLSVPIIFLLLGSMRLFFVNFTEGFIALFFIAASMQLIDFLKRQRSKDLLTGVYFLVFLALTKHIGLIDSGIIMAVTSLFLIYRKKFSLLFVSILVYIAFLIPPYYFMVSEIGTIAYGVGTLYLPTFVPFGELITKTILTSKFQYDNFVWHKLSYQVDQSIGHHITRSLSYIVSFRTVGTIYTIIGGILVSASIFISSKKNLLITITAFLVAFIEFLIMTSQNTPIYQYTFVLLLILVIGVLTALSEFVKKSNFKVLYLVLMLFFFVSFFTVGPHSKIYGNTGRKTESMEILYKKVADYIEHNPKMRQEKFLASDPQFGYWTQQDYLWKPEVCDISKKENVDQLTNYYGVKYIVITSTNLINIGFYDEIPIETYLSLYNTSGVSLKTRFNNSGGFIEIWEIL